MPSTVPTPTFTATGFVAPQSSAILQAVCSDIKTAFGGTLNLDPVNTPSSLSTPQGQLASTLAALIADKNATFLFYTSQVDPRFATGRMQDAIGQIYFMSRIPAMPTRVTCTCTGLSGTVIPINAQVQDTSGNIYACTSGGTIPISGTISLLFQNIVSGAIPCISGTVTQIYSSISGWSGVTNPGGTDTDPTTLGRVVESQQAFEYRRQQSVTLNSVNMVQSIYAAVAASGLDLAPINVPVDVFVTDNSLSIAQTIKGVSLAPHSIYVAVVGGDGPSIAKAIWSKKPPGSNYAQSTVFTASTTANLVTNVMTVTAVSFGTLAIGQYLLAPGIPNTMTITGMGTNYLLQSGAQNNAAYTATSLTITAGIADPIGGTGAFTLTATAINALLTQTTTGPAGTYVNSVWMRRRTGTGAISLYNPGGVPTVVTLTATWTQFSLSSTTAVAPSWGIGIAVSTDAIDVAFGAVNPGAVPQPYVATGATVVVTTGGIGAYFVSATVPVVSSELMAALAAGNFVSDNSYYPPIAYLVAYTVPTNLPVYFNIQIVNSPNLPGDIFTRIQNAVVSAFYGGDGGVANHIGTDVFASRFYSAIMAVNPYVQIVYAYVGTTSVPVSGNSVVVNIDRYPVTQASYVNVSHA